MPSITTRWPSNCGIFEVKLDSDHAYPCLHHMRDVGAAPMGAVDVVVIDGVRGEMAGKARAVAGFRRMREVVQQSREFAAGHVAIPNAR